MVSCGCGAVVFRKIEMDKRIYIESIDMIKNQYYWEATKYLLMQWLSLFFLIPSIISGLQFYFIDRKEEPIFKLLYTIPTNFLIVIIFISATISVIISVSNLIKENEVLKIDKIPVVNNYTTTNIQINHYSETNSIDGDASSIKNGEL